jgi:predicted ATPase
VERPGVLVTKQELLDAVWPDVNVTEGVLKRAVLEVRKALADPAEEPCFIQTLHRRGYRFIGPRADAKPSQERRGIVGRDAELVQLDAWFEEARHGARRVVFITGEGGIGKTTLVDEWAGRAAGPGTLVARGACLEQSGVAETYLPIFDALESLSRDMGRRFVDHMRTHAPAWLLHMPALLSPEERAKLQNENSGSSRERMARELTVTLETFSTENAVILIVEDLQWADPSTIDLLSMIAVRTSPARLMVVGTYRPEEAGPVNSRLRRAKNELELRKACRVLPLMGFTQIETLEYLQMRFTASHYVPELASALHRRADGHPRFLACLVDEMEQSGELTTGATAVRDVMPDALQHLFERRAAALSDAEREVLEVAAMAGPSFSVSVVAAALSRDEEVVELLCEAIASRHAIVKRSDGHRCFGGQNFGNYLFVHSLCRDAVCRAMAPGRRARLQRRMDVTADVFGSGSTRAVTGLVPSIQHLTADAALCQN